MNLHTLNKAIEIKINTILPFIIALFLILLDNISLWRKLVHIKAAGMVETIIYYSPFFFVLTLVFALFFILIRFKYLFKPIIVLILLTASIAAYFMDSFGVMIDKSMIQNVLETDISESLELLNVKLFFYFIFLGVVPSLIVIQLPLHYKPFLKQMVTNLIAAIISLIIIVSTVYYFYGDFAPLYRSNRNIRHLINPVNYIKSISSNIKRLLKDKNKKIKPLGEDASLSSKLITNKKKSLIILVVGETARAKNFSLNGYSRKTNPYLEQENIIFFNNFYSCGTATAISVPCMFSLQTHNNYDESESKYTENLLDVLEHAGIDVLWQDNNSGCKGVCNRVLSKNMSHIKDTPLCNDKECFDEILLKNLQEYIDSRKNDTVIILHQKGSHGPSYYLRTPKLFQKFRPICKDNQVNNCSKESLINAYDNTILYTDFFLHQVLQLLKRNANKFNTAMTYVSDHGESLGEKNMYLHGLPYLIAPDEQIHVPFILWLSDQLKQNLDINSLCLEQKNKNRYSHDNLFHTILGLMRVRTNIYNNKLDLISSCLSVKTK